MRPPPRPASSRPASSKVNVGARPAIADPAAISSWPAKSEGSGPPPSAHTPARTMPSSSAVSMNENASPYDRTASRSLATAGIAVEIAMFSNAMMVTSASRATVSSRYADPMGPPDRASCWSVRLADVTVSCLDSGLRTQPDGRVGGHQSLGGQRATGHQELGAPGRGHRLGAEVGDDQDALAGYRLVDQSHDLVGVAAQPAQRARSEPAVAPGGQHRAIQLERGFQGADLTVDGERRVGRRLRQPGLVRGAEAV